MHRVNSFRLAILVLMAVLASGARLHAQQTNPRVNAEEVSSWPTEGTITSPQEPAPVFESVSIEDGLPENSVCCMLQDYLGYLWIGTQNGLSRYDGYSIKVFHSAAQGSNGPNAHNVEAIIEDKDKVLWVATMNGLSRFDRTEDSFTTYTCTPQINSTINSNETRCICEDKKGRLWVGTYAGLNFFDRDKGTFTRYYFVWKEKAVTVQSSPGQRNLRVYAVVEDPFSGDLLIGTELQGLWRFSMNAKTLSKYEFRSAKNYDKQLDHIQSFYTSRDGKIWISSYNALARLDPYSKECRLYLEFPISNDDRYNYPSSAYGFASEDKSGLIWAGFYAEGRGVFSVDPKTGSVRRYDPFDQKEKNTYEARLLAIYVDRSDIVWVGTWFCGLKKWSRRKYQFQVVQNVPAVPERPGTTFSMCYDSPGILWSSTEKGLYRYQLKTGRYRSYFAAEKSVTDHPVFVTLMDASGYLWLGTRNSGFLRFDPHRESRRFYFNTPDKSIQKPFVAMQDRSGYLWIGTDGYGLYRYDPGKDRLIRFRHRATDSTSLIDDQIRSVYEDRRGTLWIGTNLRGLAKFDRQRGIFTRYGFECVLALFEDSKGRFWVGDYLSGLSLFDREKGVVLSNYSRKNGLLSNAVWGIQEDGYNNLWIETDHGLLKFNPETAIIRRYTEEDGLADNFLKPFGNCKGTDGTIYFSSQKGVVAFHPDSIRDDPTPPAVVINSVSPYNKPGEKLKYEGFISELQELTLSHDQNDLLIEYVGLQFSEPARNSYKYILENFDKQWVNAGAQRSATYTNLDPGRYVFHVKASNRDGVWNEVGASIAIVITPPWWRTWWAYILYALGLIGTGYFMWMLQLRRVKTKHAYEMTRFEAQKLQEVDQIKSRFFTNISHEFRTPLTLILGPVKQIAERMEDEKTKEELGIVHRNARTLLTLVNQLLDISKLESGSMHLRASPRNVVPLLKSLVVSFTPYAERKKIILKFSPSDDEILAYIDREKVESIVTNILSNAFKFTPEAGLIELSVFRDDNQVNICISDTGIGIPKDKLPKIFDRFYQVDGTHTREQEGTGIGLALTKELVDLHKGTITVDSEEGRGTVVTVSIPLGKKHLKSEEIVDQPVSEEEVSVRELASVPFEKPRQTDLIDKLGTDSNRPIVLLVEDNSDVRYYIRENIGNEYCLLESEDGEDGWVKATDCLPDIVVSDVMMPKMDGFELCTKLKTDERTSHIPVILLTAKAATQDKIEGFETGADAYIMKPFEPEELKARMRNLIAQRKRLHDHFRKHGIVGIDESKIMSIDKKFLQKVFHIITGNISNASFGVESLAEMAAVSRSVLHRKIVSLTGEAPVELIRRIRLARAAEMIEKKVGNMSEIALEVGFANPSYFSECFKKQYGVSPSEYHSEIGHD